MWAAQGVRGAAATSFLNPSGRSSPRVFVLDTNGTPGQGSRTARYEDSKGFNGQPANELLYIYVDWDNTSTYVRWNARALPSQIKLVYYLLGVTNGSIERFLLGSVSEHVVHYADINTLVVR